MKNALEKLGTNLRIYLAYKGLQINALKYQLLIVGRQFLADIEQSDTLSVNFLGNQLVEEENVKLLGVTIDKSLNFSQHVDQLIAKCQLNLSFLWRTGAQLEFQHRKMLANAIVTPHLDYCSSLYHIFISKREINRIESLQYRIMRFVCGIKRNERVSATHLREKLNWDTCYSRRQQKLFCTIYSALRSSDCPIYLNRLIHQNTAYNTRFQTQLAAYNNKYSRCTFNYIYCNQFVKLPGSVINSETLECFGKNLIEYYRQ